MNIPSWKDRNAVKPSTKCSINRGIGSTGVKKSTKRTGRRSSGARDFKEPGNSCPVLPDRGTYCTKTTEWIPAPELCSLLPSEKIKLQLFPVDECTRIRLEKDGHNPYLELTLKARKKISSVLKHLDNKWGSSSVALGVPMLFPYNTVENLSSCRQWTSNDSGISAGDVYAAVGSPAIFRLRYGWFCNPETKTCGVPSISTTIEDCLQSEGRQKGCITNMENRYECEAADAVEAQKIYTVPVDSQVDERKLNNDLGQPSALWVDSLTNISIGSFLSESSLLGMLNNSDPKSYGSNASFHTNHFFSDSLDAVLAGFTNNVQGPRLPTEGLCSSILDAEETCHAFPLQKLSSSGKVGHAFGGRAYSGASCQDGGPKLLKLPNLDKVNSQTGFPQDDTHQETKTDLLLYSRAYDDERSLGLTGITWTDSLGPFDGIPPTQKLIGGDNASVSEFVK
ncbi:TSL-kinase interacting protein 1 [Quillaja saponaria]|uniref:TSL-kinase interacting protein 1 n=1 Tax=Quillaja saponaria TaxID=32244 RepID=A0AAD7PIK0_QUISA|nr:TSL-kinase interacting protein 1 [Quillaja saponaria]